jgi:hypothetical protein
MNLQPLGLHQRWSPWRHGTSGADPQDLPRLKTRHRLPDLRDERHQIGQGIAASEQNDDTKRYLPQVLLELDTLVSSYEHVES